MPSCLLRLTYYRIGLFWTLEGIWRSKGRSVHPILIHATNSPRITHKNLRTFCCKIDGKFSQKANLCLRFIAWLAYERRSLIKLQKSQLWILKRHSPNIIELFVQCSFKNSKSYKERMTHERFPPIILHLFLQNYMPIATNFVDY